MRQALTCFLPMFFRFERTVVKSGSGLKLFQDISVDADDLRFESYLATGEVYNSFKF